MVKKWHLYLTVICLISGVLLITLFKTQQAVRAEAASKKANNLISVIDGLEKETDALEEKIAALREQIDAIQKEQISGEDRMASLKQELETLKMQAGLTEVEGPGVIVVLDDNAKGAEAAKTSDLSTYNPEKFIIHDKNVLYVVNDLKNAGAEAISVNNQRIVTTSNIRCVGTVILVNSTRMAPPYEIKAIGDPEKLEQGVVNGIDYSYLKKNDFPVKIIKEDNIVIPAYKGSYSPVHAQPQEQEESNNE
ncbi:DUF881 domain-containing protein [Zhaonella formicivorans]|uniref:DUF881 domain-containing protein n=1 Tax=Zhaonella formicivorans TaxID=2528593 RepID=UPI0010E7DC52|nr:DUF881 domain-containing protein [Zhaonella formicivorans]